jgi:hypothetical protein
MLTFFGARYPYSFFGFGYPRAVGSYQNYLLGYANDAGFDVWAANRWGHTCLAFEKARGFIKVAKVKLFSDL